MTCLPQNSTEFLESPFPVICGIKIKPDSYNDLQTELTRIKNNDKDVIIFDFSYDVIRFSIEKFRDLRFFASKKEMLALEDLYKKNFSAKECNSFYYNVPKGKFETGARPKKGSMSGGTVTQNPFGIRKWSDRRKGSKEVAPGVAGTEDLEKISMLNWILVWKNMFNNLVIKPVMGDDKTGKPATLYDARDRLLKSGGVNAEFYKTFAYGQIFSNLVDDVRKDNFLI